jgi:hypothetical protein
MYKEKYIFNIIYRPNVYIVWNMVKVLFVYVQFIAGMQLKTFMFIDLPRNIYCFLFVVDLIYKENYKNTFSYMNFYLF